MTGTSAEKTGTGAGFIECLRAILLYTALTVEIAVVLVDKSNLHNPYESYIFRGTFALTLLAVLLGDYTIREWIWIAAGAAFGFFCYRMTGRNEILRVLVFVAACKGRSGKRMLETVFFETLSGCLLILILSVTGIFGQAAVIGDFKGNGVEILRYSLGFGHPNALHCMFIMLVLMGMLVYEKSIRWPQYLALFVVNVLLFVLTRSRTGAAIAGVIILAGAILSLSDDKKEGLRKGRGLYVTGTVILFFSVAFSAGAAAISEPMWRGDYDRTSVIAPLVPRVYDAAHLIDAALTNRISELYWASEKAGIDSWTLFSSRAAERYFDMGWCRLFYWYGIVPAVLAIVMLLLLVRYCRLHEEAHLLIVIAAVMIYTIPEAHLISVYIGRNFLLPVFGVFWPALLHADKGNAYGIGGFVRKKAA